MNIKTQSCCFGKQLQEECRQKNTVEIRLLSDLTGKDKTVYIWTARLPMTEVSVTTICRYHKLFYSDLFFQKTANFATSTTRKRQKRKKKPDGAQNIT